MTCADVHEYENGRCVDCGATDDLADPQLAPQYERSLREVGEALGMSPQMVHNVEQRALAKLRRIMKTKPWWREAREARRG